VRAVPVIGVALATRRPGRGPVRWSPTGRVFITLSPQRVWAITLLFRTEGRNSSASGNDASLRECDCHVLQLNRAV